MKNYEDGAFDREQYQKAPYRVVWILKEPLDYPFNSQRECFEDACKKENLGPTWEPMAYVAYGILNIKGGKYPSWEKIPQLFQHPTGSAASLKSVASINVKKIPNDQCNGKSVNKEIIESFEANKDLIFKQLDDLDPQILIFGYPEELKCIVEQIYQHFEGETEQYKIQEHINDGTVAATANKSKSRLYLWAYHPSYYKSEIKQCTYYEDILKAVSDFLQSQKKSK